MEFLANILRQLFTESVVSRIDFHFDGDFEGFFFFEK